MADLTWSFKKKYDNCGGDGSWISLDITSGDEDTKPKITVEKATKPTDCASGFVILSLSNGEEEIIEVSRCIPECTCEMVNFTPGITTVDKDGSTTPIQIGTYTKGLCDDYINVSTDGLVLCKPTWSNGVIKATVNKNPHTAQRTGYYSFLFKGEVCKKTEVTQDGQTDSCINDTTCGSLAVNFATTPIPTDGETGTITITPTSCWAFVESSSTVNWITVNGTTIKVGKNRSKTSGRSGIVSATFYNASRGETCTKSVTIEQTYTPVCDCDTTLPYINTYSPFPATGITCESANPCADCRDIAVVSFRGNLSNCTDLVVTVDTTDSEGTKVSWVKDESLCKVNNIYKYKATIDENTVTTDRKAFINVYVNGTKCTKSEIIQMAVPKPNCRCSEMDITTSGKTDISGDGGRYIVGTYKFGEGVTCQPETIKCANLAGVPWIKGLYVDIENKQVIATLDVYDDTSEEAPEERSADLLLIIADWPCPNDTKIVIKQKKKSVTPTPTSNITINVEITNNSYNGIHYDGNRYGFNLEEIEFVIPNEESLKTNITNIILKGEQPTMETFEISDSYEEKKFSRINLHGTNGNGDLKVLTTCNFCGEKKFSDDALYKITMV